MIYIESGYKVFLIERSPPLLKSTVIVAAFFIIINPRGIQQLVRSGLGLSLVYSMVTFKIQLIC